MDRRGLYPVRLKIACDRVTSLFELQKTIARLGFSF